MATSSGTDAGIGAMSVLLERGAKRGDEVITPALAFAASANCILAADPPHPSLRPLENLFYPSAMTIIRTAERLLGLPEDDLIGDMTSESMGQPVSAYA